MSIPTPDELQREIMAKRTDHPDELGGLINQVLRSTEITSEHLFVIMDCAHHQCYKAEAAERLAGAEDVTTRQLVQICDWRYSERATEKAAEALCQRVMVELKAIVDSAPMVIVQRFPDLITAAAQHHRNLLVQGNR